ncbi:insulinase family protein [bacterium]|nr:insulinase family protein [bacterium]
MRTRLTGLLLAACLLPASRADARAHSVQEAMDASPKLELNVPDPETFELDNGIRVWVLENERLPLVTVRAVVRTGSLWEPAEKSGVAELAGAMMRAGGTAKWSPDELDEELDFLAANLSSNIGSDKATVSLNVLTENLEAALGMFADVLVHPSFDTGRMDIQKNLIKEDIRRQNDNPVQVGIREFSKLVWGPEHPRARTPTEESVDALGRADLAAFHARFFRPGNVIIGVAGDVSRKRIRKLLNESIGSWRGPATAYPDLPEPAPLEPRVAFAAKDVPQTTIIMGHLGPYESDENRASGEVMMQILGAGGFTSYIVDRIRNDEGLAYFAGGFLRFGRLDPGMVIGIALSKSESTCRAADLLVEQMDRIRDNEVTDAELHLGVSSLLNSQAFDYDSPGKIVNRLMDLVYYGLPEDHDQEVIARIGSVTKADVQRAARAIVDPSNLSCLAVGNPDAMDCDWKTFADRLGVELVTIELE